MSEHRIKKIVIVGGGSAGWMAAAAMSKILGPQYAHVTLVESDSIGIVGVGESTIPQMAIFNRLLDLDENEFISQTHGTFKLGIDFRNWGHKGNRYIHPFGPYGVNMNGVSFHAYWLRAHHAGDRHPLEDYSLQSIAGMEDRFMRSLEGDGTSLLSKIAYAYHLDASLYGKFLRRYSEARGVVRREGKIARVDQNGETGFIEAVVLESGERIEGELFIDCTGFRGLLIEQTLKAGYEDWSRYLPNNRAIAIQCENDGPTTPFTRATAHEAGWQWRIPLQHRVGTGYVYCTDFISDDEATATLMANLDGKPLTEPWRLSFTGGRRKKAWVKNCVALGLAGGFMEPLESTSLHLIQSGISKLLTLFPARDFSQPDIDRFNSRTALEWEQVRDFLALHYQCTTRNDTPYWDHCRNIEIPDTLKEKYELFQSYGRIFRDNDELFNDTSWMAVMVGQGMMSKSWDPVAESISLEETRARLAEIRRVVRTSADYMPPQVDFIRKHCAMRPA